jgi:preprotein translocase subunit SecA
MNAIEKVLTKIFGSANERLLKKLWPVVARINALEPGIKQLSDEQFCAKTEEFKAHLRAKTEEFEARWAERLEGAEELSPEVREQMEEERKQMEREALDEILPEAFACVREASARSTGMRHFDVQLIGGMILHRGMIAEMRTGEGKTLVATLPVYLNALLGKGVHVVTVNDYLAKRDAEWMGKIYKFLGMTVGIIQNDMDDSERQEAYKCDITYGTNNEFGFDYLRDNMKFELATCVQRGHYYAIVDEVDSILIDEARTPLIISGAADDSTAKYKEVNRVIPLLKRDEHYQVDEKQHRATLTEPGIKKAEQELKHGNLFNPSNMEILHCLNQALVAHTLYYRDKHYIVRKNEVVIVDEFTGRIMTGRRWSDGLHQAVEAKENVKIERETQTLATVTLQNYFRMYQKLAGMTGTAETESVEFAKIYNLEVAVVPTHREMIRKDNPDAIYSKLDGKWKAVINEIKELHEKGQPILVGTVSVENSELISDRLKQLHIKHEVLNAKPENAGREAEIVAQAGRKGAVTIATNMAGRGTDILLGGNAEFLGREWLKLKKKKNPDEATPEELEAAIAHVKPDIEKEHKEVVDLGGLHILGTERHESRRIDNQLRGRSGRQGDPGSSRFYLSLEDDLMRIFAGDRVKAIMQRFGMEEGVAIESKMVTKRIEAAQKNVEGHNYTIRKHLLEYDDVMNKQRTTIYSLRRQLLEQTDQREYILKVAKELLDEMLEQYLGPQIALYQSGVQNLREQLGEQFGIDISRELEEETGDIFDSLEALQERNPGKLKERLDKQFGVELAKEGTYLDDLDSEEARNLFWEKIEQQLRKKFAAELEKEGIDLDELDPEERRDEFRRQLELKLKNQLREKFDFNTDEEGVDLTTLKPEKLLKLFLDKLKHWKAHEIFWQRLETRIKTNLNSQFGFNLDKEGINLDALEPEKVMSLRIAVREWDVDKLKKQLKEQFGADLAAVREWDVDKLKEQLQEQFGADLASKGLALAELEPEQMRELFWQMRLKQLHEQFGIELNELEVAALDLDELCELLARKLEPEQMRELFWQKFETRFKKQLYEQFSDELDESEVAAYNLDKLCEILSLKLDPEKIKGLFWQKLEQKYAEKEAQYSPKKRRGISQRKSRMPEKVREIMLETVDAKWKDHLLSIDHLKEWVNQVGYAQKDPLVEYKKNSYEMFEEMLNSIDIETVQRVFTFQLSSDQEEAEQPMRRTRRGKYIYTKANANAAVAGDSGNPRTVINRQPKLNRNDPCPCGSGKKYKRCHGDVMSRV